MGILVCLAIIMWHQTTATLEIVADRNNRVVQLEQRATVTERACSSADAAVAQLQAEVDKLRAGLDQDLDRFAAELSVLSVLGGKQPLPPRHPLQ